MITTNAKTFAKQLSNFESRLEKVAASAVTISTKRAVQNFLKFDDVESSIVSSKASSSVGIAGASLEDSEYSLPALTDMLATELTAELQRELESSIKEAFNGGTA